MIITGSEIVAEWQNGRIHIDPFESKQVNPNSYNFTLGDSCLVYNRFPLDTRSENSSEVVKVPPEGLLLEPRRLYLASTREVLGSEHYAPTFAARSSIARLGLFINLSACLGDIGFIGRWTLQLYAIHPVRVYPGMPIGQMMWWRPSGRIVLYDGKYQGSVGPTATLIHRDYMSETRELRPTPAAAVLPFAKGGVR